MKQATGRGRSLNSTHRSPHNEGHLSQKDESSGPEVSVVRVSSCLGLMHRVSSAQTA